STNKEIYQQAIGALLWLMVGTRPDICFVVGYLSRFNANPSEQHWQAVKRVMRYLKGTKNYAITYSGRVQGNWCGYSDASYADDRSTRRSTAGYVFCVSGGAISWSSKQQSVVARSTTEAEYIALAQAAKEAMWLRTLQRDVHPL